MKFKKSKLPETHQETEQSTMLMKVFKKNETDPRYAPTKKELRIQAEEQARKRSERLRKIKKGIGKFFMILFIACVIFSMVIVPLLIVFA